jgi:hypothetical protein
MQSQNAAPLASALGRALAACRRWVCPPQADTTKSSTFPGHNADAPAASAAFPDVIATQFDAAFYLETYKDVAQAGTDPWQHWLSFGWQEDRQISRYTAVRYGNDAARSTDRGWKLYRWQGHDIAVKMFDRLPQQITAQIASQRRHDPAILAAGEVDIAKLGLLDRENAHLDVAGLRRAFLAAPDYLAIVPGLTTSGGALPGTLLAALRDLGSVRTIVTDQGSPAAAETNSIAKPLDLTSNVFWRDYWITGPEELKIVQLAQLIRVLRPRATIVANSPHGYEAVARFGQALAERTALFCVYTADAEGLALTARYEHRTLPRAVTLTDDGDLAARLREKRAEVPERRVVALSPGDRAGFARQVAALFGSA